MMHTMIRENGGKIKNGRGRPSKAFLAAAAAAAAAQASSCHSKAFDFTGGDEGFSPNHNRGSNNNTLKAKIGQPDSDPAAAAVLKGSTKKPSSLCPPPPAPPLRPSQSNLMTQWTGDTPKASAPASASTQSNGMAHGLNGYCQPRFLQFVGPSCGHHASYTFYKAIKYTKNGRRPQVLGLGEFFFVKIWPNSDLVAIGELQLLWEDRNTNQILSSLRLYFLPEYTPDGRLHHHGEVSRDLFLTFPILRTIKTFTQCVTVTGFHV